MSRGTRLSVLGLYKFNNHLFDDLRFPEGFSDDEKNTVIGNILAECAELECLFPDYDFCKLMIGLWSKLNLPTWQRIYNLSQMDYNPIENYNRTEKETITTDQTDKHSGNDTKKDSGTDTQLVQSTSTDSNTGTDTNVNSMTAYDSNTMYAHDKSEMTYGHKIDNTNTGSNATNYGKTETFTHGETIDREGETVRENHMFGNIGTMTTQQMGEQEIEISPKLNVMNMIVSSFKERFCLLVY